MKNNYYMDQIDNVLRDHDPYWPLKAKFYGSKNNSNTMTVPIDLLYVIRDWYKEHTKEDKYVSAECLICSGTGRLTNKKCPSCSGTGKEV